MTDAHGETHRPDDETPEEPRFELRLQGDGDDSAPDPAPEPARPDPYASAPEPVDEPADEQPSDGAGSLGSVLELGGARADEPAHAAVDEHADEPVTPEPAPAAPVFELADEQDLADEVDEVLVFQMDEDDDLGPSLPEGLEGEIDGPATYSDLSEPAPVGEVDEFSELGETWEARLSGEEPEDFEAEQPDRRRQVALAAGAGALVALAIFAFGGDDPAGEAGGEPGIEVARGGATDRDARGGSTDGATNDAADEVVASAKGTREPAPPREPRAPRSMVAGLSELFAPMAGSGGGTGAIDRDPDGVAASLFGGDRSLERREGYIPVDQQVVLPDPLPNLQMADAGDFAHLWMQPGLPPDGVHHATFMQTPLFGSARVHTSAQEFFDGRLVGLGAGRIALDTGAGELVLAADQVAAIERLVAGEHATDALVARTTGEHVRVRAAGGWLRGEVVREDADTVTLLLESGGRITVDRSVVRPAAEAGRPRLAEPPITG